MHRIFGHGGQGVSGFTFSGGHGLESSWSTDRVCRWHVPRQSAVVSPPMMMTFLPATVRPSAFRWSPKPRRFCAVRNDIACTTPFKVSPQDVEFARLGRADRQEERVVPLAEFLRVVRAADAGVQNERDALGPELIDAPGDVLLPVYYTKGARSVRGSAKARRDSDPTGRWVAPARRE
jgi:hypothetical protein